MSVEKEIWRRDIEEAVFKDNGFLEYAFNADEYVVGGAVVHIPQSGGPGSVVKNRASLPATIRRRIDTDIVYPLDEYTSDPMLIVDAEKKELSYDKRNSAIGEDKQAVAQTVAEDFLNKWATALPAASILETTGGAVAASAAAAMGNRKALLRTDLQRAKTLMNKQEVAKNDRYALIPAEMAAQLFPDDVTTATLMRNVSDDERKQGVIAILHGFKIMERSSVVVYDSTGALKAVGAVGDTGDCEGVLCWQKNAVERAKGTIDFFEDQGKPEYYGDVYSMLIRAGGRRRREDNKGVVVIRQASA